MANGINQHAEWLSLIEVSGPFLAEPVLKQAFPQGLDKLNPIKKQRFRQAYEEWQEAIETSDPLQEKLHQEWINWVLTQGLEWDEDDDASSLKAGSVLPENLKLELLEHNLTLKPDFALFGGDETKPYLLVMNYPTSAVLNDVIAGDGWATSPAERMSQLCRSTKTYLGLVTNGEQWMLVYAPKDGITSYASWYARLWSQEPVTLNAFYSLLNIATVYNGLGAEAKQLTQLYDDSLQFQDEVTETLGAQVQRAVEVLVQSIDRINNDANGKLLAGVAPTELYEAGLTYMMRLVFMLCAEERGLLLLGDETYEANYAVSTLRMKLREEAGLHGEEVLSYRHNAWSRLLATFRAVYGGIEHETMRMPALGGSLFDPDRFPFLEGRAKGSNWKIEAARPLAIDNRTVLLFLDAIQIFQGRTLSYRALDVEQIGYVYEGLLERTVIRSPDVTLELKATKNAKKPWLLLGELASAELDGKAAVTKLLKDRTGSSASRVKNDLEKEVSEAESERLLVACQNDAALRDRIKPYFHFLRADAWGNALIYLKDAYMVATGDDRRETGTHYTPKSLTEAIVLETLEPVVYIGPSLGTPRQAWQLKTPEELLDLKICDPAMGSGAFLVQVCRYLSERLCEAWLQAEEAGGVIILEERVADSKSTIDPLPNDAEERLLVARRLIAEHCLYGVDVNPLAVELAKLAVWLVTLSKGRPFGFLDHNLKSGNSLLGIHDLNQLYYLDMKPEGIAAGGGTGKQLFAQNIEAAVKDALVLRTEIRERPVRDIRDVEVMEHLNEQAREFLAMPVLLADAFVAEVMASSGNAADIRNSIVSLAVEAGEAIAANQIAIRSMTQRTNTSLAISLPLANKSQRPFHWPLEFPEVFSREENGFNAIIGNPPFLGNRLWKTSLGDKAQWLCHMVLSVPPGKIDLCVVFHRRAAALLGGGGTYGLLATSNIAEGSAIGVGLGVVVEEGDIYFARKSLPWPGTAAVIVSIIGFFKGDWRANCDADESVCNRIGSRLEPEASDAWLPQGLKNSPFAFEGVNNSKGLAFVIESDDPWFERLKNESISLLRPYVTGDDITSSSLLDLKRWALDIADRELEDIRKNWPIAHQFLIEVVQPTRTQEALQSYKGLDDRWWQFWNHRVSQMNRLRKGDEFIAFSKVTKYPICMLAPTDWICTNKVLLVENSRPDLYAICLSSFFRIWLQVFSGGKLEGRLSLSITESVGKFPFPFLIAAKPCVTAAEQFGDLALKYSADRNCGLTGVMNSVHDPSNEELIISKLRNLLVSIDTQIAAAYEWFDLDVEYDFHGFSGGSANDNWRWSLSTDATYEMMARLTDLNREHYEAEKPPQRRFKVVARSKKYEVATEGEAELDKVAEPSPQNELFGPEKE